MSETKDNKELIKKIRSEFARSGGLAVLKKYSKKHFSLLGKKSGEARRKLSTRGLLTERQAVQYN